MSDEELPPSVQRALQSARTPPSREGRWLALIPVTALVVTFALVMPRATPPTEVPLPQIDGPRLRAVIDEDVMRAENARAARLPGDVLAVGSALRAINKAAAEKDAETVGSARVQLEGALRGLSAQEPDRAVDLLKTLRAVQLEGFLVEVHRFEANGEPSTELVELGGAFVERMTDAGWVNGRTVLLNDAQRRSAFKAVWTAMVGGESTPSLSLSVDEQRALYTLYFTNPHVPDSQRASFAAMRSSASDAAECLRVTEKERLAAEVWRAEKIRKFGEIDPSYPTNYALGVSYYRAGRYDMSADAFRAWLDVHPDGALAIRARNHWMAARKADGQI